MRSADDYWKTKAMPLWKQRFAIGNPPTSQRRRWRQEYRCKMNRAVKIDPENVQAFPMNRVTCIYDWY